MSYSAAQIVAAFLDANATQGWSARSYTTDALEQVHFTVPSKIVRVTYDCNENHFIIGFEKIVTGWGDYVRAIARTVHFIFKTLQAGGLDFAAPDSEDGMEITILPRQNGLTVVRVKSL